MPNRNAPGTTAKRQARQSAPTTRKKLPNILGLATPKASQAQRNAEGGQSALSQQSQKPKTPCTRASWAQSTQRARHTQQRRRPKAGTKQQRTRPEPEKASDPNAMGGHTQQKPQRAPATNPTARRKTNKSESEKKTNNPIFL